MKFLKLENLICDNLKWTQKLLDTQEWLKLIH